MRELPPGWQTDLAVLEHSGSVIEEHGDHLLVRSPHNPTFHWGNCLFITDESTLDDAETWVQTFHAGFPEATWVAIGLIRMPEDEAAWTAQGLDLELDDVLTTRELPRQTPLQNGYSVRRLSGDDWAQYVVRYLAENERTGEFDPTGHAEFMQRQADVRRSLSERDVAAFFGAFVDDVLVADLGIVCCGATACYQSVGINEDHRRRGLASHLLGVAARWPAERGCDRWVIITEATNPAGIAYRKVGFTPDVSNAQAYRKPPRH